jgi:hypothetical protein
MCLTVAQPESCLPLVVQLLRLARCPVEQSQKDADVAKTLSSGTWADLF